MKTAKLADMMVTLVIGVACIALGGPFGMLATVAQAQSAAVDVPAGVEDIVKLTKAGMSEDIVLAKVKKAGVSYDLTTDQMIYLKNQGVSQNVITALLQAGPAATPPPPPVQASLPPPPQASQPSVQPPMAAPPAPAPPVQADAAPEGGPEINFQYFHDQLSPFGTWVEVPGFGPAWRPADAITGISPDWRPYYDNGQWVHTDNGLFWQSDYTWGDIPFHYGRWIRNPAYGWVWVPDYTWGPAWVFWRHAEQEGAMGWAPLPVGAVFVDGAFIYNGVHVGAEFDFGLGEDYFVFVDGAHFHERYFRLRGREWRYHIDRERMHGFYGRSVVRNEFHRDEHGRFVNEGIGRDRVDRMTNHRVEQAKMEERHPIGDREKAATGREGSAGKGGPTAGKGGGAPPSKVFRPPAPAAAQKSNNAQAQKKK